MCNIYIAETSKTRTVVGTESKQMRRSISIFIRPITDNLNAIGHAVGQDSETKSTEHCPKYKQSTVI